MLSAYHKHFALLHCHCKHSSTSLHTVWCKHGEISLTWYPFNWFLHWYIQMIFCSGWQSIQSSAYMGFGSKFLLTVLPHLLSKLHVYCLNLLVSTIPWNILIVVFNFLILDWLSISLILLFERWLILYYMSKTIVWNEQFFKSAIISFLKMIDSQLLTKFFLRWLILHQMSNTKVWNQ